jgi:subtilase family serine protease
LRRSREQEAALRKLLDEQQPKASPNYHMWLTPEQFGEQFGPGAADIQALTGWLTSQGFSVDRVAAGRTVIEFSGTGNQATPSGTYQLYVCASSVGDQHCSDLTVTVQ